MVQVKLGLKHDEKTYGTTQSFRSGALLVSWGNPLNVAILRPDGQFEALGPLVEQLLS